MSILWYLALAAALWNVITFILYGIDKSRAVKHKWRISESTLLLCAFIMGGMGALLGMCIFHHKTKHIKFKIGVPLACIANIAMAILIVHYL